MTDVALLGLSEPLSGGHPARGIHAHVERTVKAEGKAACGVIDLRRRNAYVEKDAVGFMNADLGERRLHC